MPSIKPLFIAFILLFSAVPAQILHGQGTAATSSTVIFNHVALSVSDLDASADFYMNMFNLEEIENASAAEGIRWFSLGEGKELHL
ncbi:MAG: VOC family protein, partial [Balneolaceae bacterium]|nr:VOC family protein [Balneolaceae bacterium]